MAFHIIRNDITRMHADAIVNSANPMPTYGYGADLAIYTAAGPERILAERREIGEIRPGEVRATSAGKLKAKYILHTVAPLWEGGSRAELETLRACYENALTLARELGCKSAAFPLIATGIDGFPKDKALEVAMSAIQNFLLRNRMDVYLVIFDEHSFVLTGQIFDAIQSYVDAHYVRSAADDEYRQPSRPGDDALRGQVLQDLRHRVPDMPEPLWEPAILPASEEQTFQEKLFEYIDRSGLKPSAIYRPIEMSRQQYSRMQSNRDYQPRKATALLLAIVLHLSVAETADLLSRAGYSFNPSSRRDLIVKACLLRGEYDLYVIDALMCKYGLPTLIDYDR